MMYNMTTILANHKEALEVLLGKLEDKIATQHEILPLVDLDISKDALDMLVKYVKVSLEIEKIEDEIYDIEMGIKHLEKKLSE